MKIFSALSLALLLCLAGLWMRGLRGNLTLSMPQGLYLTESTWSGGLGRGDLVQYCPPAGLDPSMLAEARAYAGESLLCASGVRPLLKVLAGLPGDSVRLTPEGVELNGRPLPNSAIAEKDRFGQRMVSRLQDGVIPADLALLHAPHESSYDSRYFGLVPMDGLQRVRAVLTHKEEDMMDELDAVLAQARAVEAQAMDNPDLEFPLDPDLAEYMGAHDDPGLHDADDEPSSDYANGAEQGGW